MKKTPLTRTQVLFEPAQLEELNRIAEREGKSLSGLLREWIDRMLELRKNEALAQAAEQMLGSYYADGDLVGYGAIDAEDFQGRRSG